MNSQRQASMFVIALLMAGLVIVVGLSSASITLDSEDLPWENDDIVIVTVPAPITNETGHGISVIDPLVILNKKIERLNTTLQDLRMELSSLQSADRANNAEIEKLNSKIDCMETALDEEFGYLENKISSLQTTIVYACIAIAIIAILCAFFLIKKGALG